MEHLDWFGAFVVGLVGAGHCVGMCGGIASAVALNGQQQQFQITFLYNLGRLTSYMVIGALCGGAVASSLTLFDFSQALLILRVVTALFMIVLGLYLAQWWMGLTRLERLGQILWKRIAPIAAKLLPLRSKWYALPVGMLWGWVPCGMVYSMVSWAAISGSAVGGSLIMACFGLGTMPAMLLVGTGSGKLASFTRSAMIRRVIGLCLMAYGIYALFPIVRMI